MAMPKGELSCPCSSAPVFGAEAQLTGTCNSFVVGRLLALPRTIGVCCANIQEPSVTIADQDAGSGTAAEVRLSSELLGLRIPVQRMTE